MNKLKHTKLYLVNLDTDRNWTCNFSCDWHWLHR